MLIHFFLSILVFPSSTCRSAPTDKRTDFLTATIWKSEVSENNTRNLATINTEQEAFRSYSGQTLLNRYNTTFLVVPDTSFIFIIITPIDIDFYLPPSPLTTASPRPGVN